MARGPWDPDACHAGPPTGLLVRALERALPTLRLARISVELGRPVPMAGFRIVTEVVRAGRAAGNTRAAIVDGDGATRVTASGMHVAVSAVPLFASTLDNTGVVTPRLADAEPGEFPIGSFAHGRPGFIHAVEVRYPPGEDRSVGRDDGVDADDPAAARRADVAVPAHLPAGRLRQRLQPPRRARPGAVRQHRPACWPCTATRSASGSAAEPSRHWQPTGVGLTDALLFDDEGPVGRALQTLLLRPVG